MAKRKSSTDQTKQPQQQTNSPVQDEARDEANKRRFVGPQGVEASDLPGGGRDDPDTKWAHELARNLPQQHGGELGEEGGLRGDRAISEADKHGGRKRN